MNFKEQSFTLIELLVVIAIIGLLSSIVLVSLQGAKDQAELAEAQSFARQVRASLGLSLVGEWKFDDEADPTRDSSGYDNHGTLFPTGEPLYIDGVFGKVLQFDGTNDYVETADNFSVDTSKSGYTLSAWIYQVSSNGYSWNSVAGTGLDSVRFGLMTQGGTKIGAWACGNHGTGPAVGNIENEWHFILAVYSKNETGFTPVKMYLDAEYVGDSVTDRSAVCIANSKVQIAKSYGGYNTWFNGKIDEFQIYDRALSLTEIHQLYAQGSGKHNIVLK